MAAPIPTPVANVDAQRMMLLQANQKSTGVAYLLWFFLGFLGVHRFYLGRTGSGIAMLAITAGSGILMMFVIGMFTIWLAVLWVFIDLFLIPGMVREHNARIMAAIAR